MGTPSQGAQAKLAMDPSSIGVGSEAYEFISETLTHSIELIDHGAETLRGTRSHAKERVSQDVTLIGGWIHMYPSPAEFNKLLPRILGAAEVSDVFDLAETLPSFVVAISHVAKVHTFTGCYVNQAIFTSQKNRRVKLSLEVWGTSFSEGTTFPAITPDLDTSYTHQMGVLTWNSTTYAYNQAVVVIHNHLQREYNNATTPNITTRDRTILLAGNSPYTSDETALYTTPTSSPAGAAASLVWTNGGQITTLTFPNLKIYPRGPNVAGKTEIRLPWRAKAFKSGSTAECSITHDSTA